MKQKLPEPVALKIMNMLKSSNPHIFDEWDAKNIVSSGKSLQFDIKDDIIIITSIGDDKYNMKVGKKKKINITYEGVMEMLRRSKKEA